MGVVYELWDVESGNRLERFDSESEALRAARELLERDDHPVEALMLGAFRYDSETGAVERLPVLDGEALLARIRSLGAVPLTVGAANQGQAPREVTPLDHVGKTESSRSKH